MASSNRPQMPYREDMESFHTYIATSSRVLALLGAGLSASSGLPTFRGAGGLWRTHDATRLATEDAFEQDPGLVWQFYNYRRHMALKAQPNAAHYALAELARKMPGFQCLSQNVDGLSQRAQHPPGQLQLLHGTLFRIRCVDEDICGYSREDFTDPVCPVLEIPTSGIDPTSDKARKDVSDQLSAERPGDDLDISDIKVPLRSIQPTELPHCPICKTELLRPGVVWFGESLPHSVLNTVETFISGGGPIDLIIVIGTSAQVYPAAGYIQKARRKGARVAVVNMDENDMPPGGWQDGDWFFKGDAAQIVPEMLEPVIGA